MVGRKLDAWIATHITGLDPEFSPLYSLELRAAFEIVAKLLERPGVEFDLITHKGLWAACFHGLGESLYAEAKRPALAICLAAKQAVEA